MASSELVVAPVAEPVTAADAFDQLRLDDEAMLTLLDSQLVGARERAEHELGRSLITQKRMLQLTCWPDACSDFGGIRLDYPPVQEVDLVEYWDGSAWMVLADSAYTLERVDKLRHLIVPVTSWPSLGHRNGPRVRVTFTAGFGDTGASVPEVIRQWIVATAGQALDDPDGTGAAPNEFINRRLDAWRTRL